MTDTDPRFTGWAVSIAHKALVDAINREMDEYLSYYAELAHFQERTEPDHPALDERRVTIVLLVASYLEAIINVYFAFAFDAKQLKEIDRRPILEKWTRVPTVRNPAYRLDLSSRLYEDLRTLVECRNAIVHMRPELSLEDTLVHAGNGQPLGNISHANLMRWVKLPLDLIENLGAHDSIDARHTLQSVSDVWQASQGWDDRLKFYRESYAGGRGERRFRIL